MKNSKLSKTTTKGYLHDHDEKTWKIINNLKEGNVDNTNTVTSLKLNNTITDNTQKISNAFAPFFAKVSSKSHAEKMPHSSQPHMYRILNNLHALFLNPTLKILSTNAPKTSSGHDDLIPKLGFVLGLYIP